MQWFLDADLPMFNDSWGFTKVPASYKRAAKLLRTIFDVPRRIEVSRPSDVIYWGKKFLLIEITDAVLQAVRLIKRYHEHEAARRARYDYRLKCPPPFLCESCNKVIPR